MLLSCVFTLATPQLTGETTTSERVGLLAGDSIDFLHSGLGGRASDEGGYCATWESILERFPHTEPFYTRAAIDRLVDEELIHADALIAGRYGLGPAPTLSLPDSLLAFI